MNQYYGQQRLLDDASAFNVLAFTIRQKLGKVRTAVPVVVKAVDGGGVGAPPTVDVQVLVNQIDGVGNQTPHGTIYGIPVFRLQGGKNAIIADPVVNDVGLLVVADRDISSVKANKGKQSNPGSYRRHNLADGVYFGGVLNAADQDSYIQFTDKGLKVFGKGGNVITLDDAGLELDDANGNKIKMTSSGINLNGVIIDSNGNITTPGGVTAGAGTGDSVTLQHHTHTGNNIPPTPGT